jgi:hypothetical protein
MCIVTILLVSLNVKGQSAIHSDTSYYENGAINEIRTYKKRTIINHIVFDEEGNLIYQSPLLQSQKIPNYRFASGRTYFDHEKLDTIIFEKNIPAMNLSAYLPGSTTYRIDAYSFVITDWHRQPDSQKGKMVIDIYENAFFKSKRVLHKIVLVDIK